METTTQYLPFLHWLQDKYPDLYTCCWEAVSVSEEGIFINEKGLNLENYKKLVLAIEEYYGVIS